jgi:two-component system, cell cycle sensor histidine kinase and response regulator CckA
VTKARILVVEDEKLVATDIQQCLEQLGYDVVGTAASGVEALRQAVVAGPDLVLMDIKLRGGIDGIDTAEALYQRMHIPVVYLTAYGDIETVGRAKNTLPSGYVLKPFDDRALRTAVELALHRYRTETRSASQERSFAAALESIREGVIVTQQRGLITLMNKAAERMTGWKEEAALGCLLADVLTAIDAETGMLAPSFIGRVAAEGASVNLDGALVVIGKHGTRAKVRCSVSPVRDDAQRLAGAAVVLTELV